MGLFALLRRLFFGAPPSRSDLEAASGSSASDLIRPGSHGSLNRATEASAQNGTRSRSAGDFKKTGPGLRRPFPALRFESRARRTPLSTERVSRSPYQFAVQSVTGEFLDLSTDGDPARLSRLSLPQLSTPDDLAKWLGIPLGRLAWLSGRFFENSKPQSAKAAHYHFQWKAKRGGGHRLIESPKPELKRVQTRILREILDRVAVHDRAFGFVHGRSALANAAQHVQPYVLLKLDLENFYPSVRYSRVVAIFRSLGFSRAVALWLARLTTSSIPSSLAFPGGNSYGLMPYLARHLPQGAPTSPALANLSAYSLDVRLEGLARSFGATYTRYADDLTFSGNHKFAGGLIDFIPLSMKVIRSERFKINRSKRKVIRRSGRQVVTGVVVNSHLNLARPDYDRLKAILHNCVRFGPGSQNRENHPDFRSHLMGRVAYALQISPIRGEKLRDLFSQINWP